MRRNLDFDKAELMLYEPVEKMPPFSRKTLVFISPAGLRKQGIIHRLVDVNPDMFGTTIPRKWILTSKLHHDHADQPYIVVQLNNSVGPQCKAVIQNCTQEIEVLCMLFDRHLSISTMTSKKNMLNSTISGAKSSWTSLYLHL